MKLGFVITDVKGLYVAKEDSILLFCVAKETTMNVQQIKPCVLLVNYLVVSTEGSSIFVLGKLSREKFAYI